MLDSKVWWFGSCLTKRPMVTWGYWKNVTFMTSRHFFMSSNLYHNEIRLLSSFSRTGTQRKEVLYCYKYCFDHRTSVIHQELSDFDASHHPNLGAIYQTLAWPPDFNLESHRTLKLIPHIYWVHILPVDDREKSI